MKGHHIWISIFIMLIIACTFARYKIGKSLVEKKRDRDKKKSKSLWVEKNLERDGEGKVEEELEILDKLQSFKDREDEDFLLDYVADDDCCILVNQFGDQLGKKWKQRIYPLALFYSNYLKEENLERYYPIFSQKDTFSSVFWFDENNSPHHVSFHLPKKLEKFNLLEDEIRFCDRFIFIWNQKPRSIYSVYGLM